MRHKNRKSVHVTRTRFDDEYLRQCVFSLAPLLYTPVISWRYLAQNWDSSVTHTDENQSHKQTNGTPDAKPERVMTITRCRNLWNSGLMPIDSRWPAVTVPMVKLDPVESEIASSHYHTCWLFEGIVVTWESQNVSASSQITLIAVRNLSEEESNIHFVFFNATC